MAQDRSIAQSLRKLTDVKKGDNVLGVASSERINAMQDLLRAFAQGDNLVTGLNLRKRKGEGYFILSGEAGGRRSTTGDFPWEITVGTDPENPEQNQAHVRPGTINTFVPTNMFNAFNINPTGTYYVSLDCDTDGTVVTSAAINVGTSAPAPIDEDIGVAPDFFQLLLGLIVDLQVFQLIDYVLFAFPVRTVYSLKDSVMPGEPYYDLHYTWQINPSPATP